MPSFPKRARSVTRIAVGLVALGATFLGASAAQGSIGTGNQVTTNRPDMRTTTIIPTFNEVEYCFDQAIDLTGAPANQLGVGGYVAGPSAAGSALSKSSANCAQSQFAGTVDLQAATYAGVLPAVVKNSVGSLTNLADAAPLVGSTTKNGTRGNSVGPDLTIAAANVGGASNQIGYRFDQRIVTSGGGAGICANAPGTAEPGFAYYDNNGNIHNNGVLASCSNSSNPDGSGNGNVLIAFPPATSPVEESRRAYVANNQVFSTPPNSAGNPTFSVVVVGGSGTNSNDPDLLSVELSNPAGTTNSLDFTFDEGITAPVAARFHAITSVFGGGTVVNGTNVALLDSSNGTNTRARVQFSQLELFSEFIVGGYVDCSNTQGTPPAAQAPTAECTGTAAAVSANDGQQVPPNGLPAGDNANAFALG